MVRGRLHQLIFAAFLISSVSGCVAAQPKSHQPESDDIPAFPGGGAPAPAKTGYTLDTPIERIAADPEGAAVLNKDIPGLLANPNYEMFKGMSLNSLAPFSRDKLDKQTLAQTEADLAALPKPASLGR